MKVVGFLGSQKKTGNTSKLLKQMLMDVLRWEQKQKSII